MVEVWGEGGVGLHLRWACVGPRQPGGGWRGPGAAEEPPGPPRTRAAVSGSQGPCGNRKGPLRGLGLILPRRRLGFK